MDGLILNLSVLQDNDARKIKEQEYYYIDECVGASRICVCFTLREDIVTISMAVKLISSQMYKPVLSLQCVTHNTNRSVRKLLLLSSPAMH